MTFHQWADLTQSLALLMLAVGAAYQAQSFRMLRLRIERLEAKAAVLHGMTLGIAQHLREKGKP